MELNFEIFLDLDETLVNFINYQTSSKRTKIELGGDKYYGLERPLAKKMISDCRSFCPTKILTVATRDYALKVNEVFDFGFSPDEIFSREDLDRCIIKDYEFKISTHGKKNVLIDNAPNTFTYSKIKMKSLDIPENSYFQIREFNGKDPDKFTIEWNELFQKIKSHLQG